MSESSVLDQFVSEPVLDPILDIDTTVRQQLACCKRHLSYVETLLAGSNVVSVNGMFAAEEKAAMAPLLETAALPTNGFLEMVPQIRVDRWAEVRSILLRVHGEAQTVRRVRITRGATGCSERYGVTKDKKTPGIWLAHLRVTLDYTGRFKSPNLDEAAAVADLMRWILYGGRAKMNHPDNIPNYALLIQGILPNG